jgi:hypothetical protein
MGDQKLSTTELYLFGQSAPNSTGDAALWKRVQECASNRNRNGIFAVKALEGTSAADIQQLVVGHNHIAFLLTVSAGK